MTFHDTVLQNVPNLGLVAASLVWMKIVHFCLVTAAVTCPLQVMNALGSQDGEYIYGPKEKNVASLGKGYTRFPGTIFTTFLSV